MNQSHYPLGFDPTGTSTENLVLDEYHQIASSSKKPKRGIILEKGYFYITSLVVRDTGGRRLVKGTDYEVKELNAEATAITGKGVAGVVVIINQYVSSKVYIDAQMVGGEYCFMGDLAVRKLRQAQNDNRAQNWFNLTDVPGSFNPVRHKHPMSRTFGWEPFHAELAKISASLRGRNKREVEKTKAELRVLATTADTRKNDVLSQIQDHTKKDDNPHEVTLEQLKLEYYRGRIVVVSNTLYDGGNGEYFITPAAIAHAVNDYVLTPLTRHEQRLGTNAPHGLTLEQVDMYSEADTRYLAGLKYNLHEEVADVNTVYGIDRNALLEEVRSGASADNVTTDKISLQRLSPENPSQLSVLCGNNTWKPLTEIFTQYTNYRPGVFIIGDRGSFENDAAHQNAVNGFNPNDYGPSTILIYGGHATWYSDVNGGTYITEGVALHAIIRNPSTPVWDRLDAIFIPQNMANDDPFFNVTYY